jgi:hypothetical protein
MCSETSSTATGLSAGRVSGSGGHILDSADLEAVSGEGSDGRLSAGAGGLRHDTTLSAKLDVDGVDADSLEFTDDVDGGEHSSVGGGLFSVSLDFHAASDAGVGFAAGEIGDVDEGVVLGRLDVADTESILLVVSRGTANVGWAVVGNSLFLGGFRILSFLGSFGLK